MPDFSKQIMEPDFAINDCTLVEASAGTGKTYNIQNAYLRLVLKHEQKVENILVVTFTEAATHELRERLRKILRLAGAYLAKDPQSDDIEEEDDDDTKRVKNIVRISRPDDGGCKKLLDRIKLALMDFDNAAIFTIHGFCKRVLDRYAFECGHDPSAELVADESQILMSTCTEWWRSKTYNNENFRESVPFEGPTELQKYLQEFLKKADAKLLPELDRNDGGWPEIASKLKEDILNLKAVLAAPGGPKTSVPATRLCDVWLPGFIRLMKADHIDQVAIRHHFKDMKKDFDAVKKSIKELPSIVSSLKMIRLRIFAEMTEILKELEEKVQRNVKERGVLTYDDLLRNVRDALKCEGLCEQLHSLLRNEFTAALIDEFQDTDPVQYQIFDTLFRGTELPLFFVGDPKQAIYGFRGGDVFTYYSAKQSIAAERLQNLDTNYRSERRLVEGVNELFRDGDEPTFMHNAIPYDGRLKAHDVSDKKALLINGCRDSKPVKLCTYKVEVNKEPSSDKDVAKSKKKGEKEAGVPGADSDMAKRIYKDTARIILRLIQDQSVSIGGATVKPSQIAILVCAHTEAAYLYKELKTLGLNALLQSSGNVFDTVDAKEMAILIQAMLQPGDARALRGALALSMIPCSAEDLCRFCQDTPLEANSSSDSGALPASLEEWMEVIKSAGERWRKRSFVEAFRMLVEKLDLRSHIIALDDGERRLTNVMHLAELAHQAASEFRKGPVGLTGWFNRQICKDTREENDEYEMRLSSDADAVTIMTIHKSKGLEFPVVFVPTLWRKQAEAHRKNSKLISYHDAANKLIMNLDAEDQDVKDAALKEVLQENMRLAYVAMTRAKNRLYVTNVSVGDREKYALQRLIQDWRKRLNDNAGTLVEEVDPAADNMEVEPISPKRTDPELLLTRGARVHPPRVDKSHGHTSFSSIEPATKDSTDLGLRDVDVLNEVQDEETAGPHDAESGIFSIRGSAQTGECWHNIFEKIDFQGSEEQIKEIADAEIDRFGICKGPVSEIAEARRKAVHDMVGRVLNAPLTIPGCKSSFSLRDIQMSARISEMQFHFSLKQAGEALRTPDILRVLTRYWEDDPDKGKNFLPSLNSWNKELPLGFMTGFIDLVCCHAGRFYILDWKSNKRSGDIKGLNKAGVLDEMGRHAYFLQYLIYSVSLHGFLSRELQGYSYEKHFGGVFYVFLRGVTGEPGSGIFADRPSQNLIEELSRLLSEGGVQ